MPKTTIAQRAKSQLKKNKQTYQDSGNPHDTLFWLNLSFKCMYLKTLRMENLFNIASWCSWNMKI